MSAPDDLPEPDKIEGAPHPRMATALFGQEAAERAFLDAFNSGRQHHAWLLTGPRGVGKATLAWRIAKFLIATPPPTQDALFSAPAPDSLDIPDTHPALSRIAALSEPGVMLVRRGPNDKGDKLKTAITVDEVRKLNRFFSLSMPDGGARVVIVDCADEMNRNAANALLKLLEEPPANTTLILVSHIPSRLLPTIRSRCRTLKLDALGPAAMGAVLAASGVETGALDALGELAGGSAGEAIALLHNDGLRLYADLVALFASLPNMDRQIAVALSEAATGRGAEARFDLTLDLIERLLARLARAGTLGRTPPEIVPGEAAMLARLSPDPVTARGWADLSQSLAQRARRGKAVNLDPAALILDMCLRIDKMAARLPA